MYPVSISGFSRRDFSGIDRIFHFWGFYELDGYRIGLLDHLVYFLNCFCGLPGRWDYFLGRWVGLIGWSVGLLGRWVGLLDRWIGLLGWWMGRLVGLLGRWVAP